MSSSDHGYTLKMGGNGLREKSRHWHCRRTRPDTNFGTPMRWGAMPALTSASTRTIEANGCLSGAELDRIYDEFLSSSRRSSAPRKCQHEGVR